MNRNIFCNKNSSTFVSFQVTYQYIVTMNERLPRLLKYARVEMREFQVIKRDGESSLMQLKQEYRDYDSLRREHDAQIVQIAVEAGLRISPDQWSSLLYGDQSHRSHMQSIIDKVSLLNIFLLKIRHFISTT